MNTRILILVVTAIATTFTLGKSILNSTPQTAEVADFTFPESVPLPQGKFIASSAVTANLERSPTHIAEEFMAGKQYRYLHHNKLINIEMRYLNNTNGDLKKLITQHGGEVFPTLRQNQERGFYSLFNRDGKAYLSACINPRGDSTMTGDQFHRNRLIYDARLERVIPWLLGKAQLQDRRCLWAHLSMPLKDDATAEETYRTLEIVWYDWYDWWRSHYPDS